MAKVMTSVIIVNWNSGSQLFECVNSVNQHGAQFVDQIIVVDNGSTDGSESTVEGLPNVTLLRAGANLGFGRACNVGAAQGNSEFFLFLNPDAYLLPDSLSKVLAFMQKPENTKTGICGIQLLDESGHLAHSCARFPSASGFISHAIGIDRLIPTQCHFMSEWDHGTTRQVDHVIGAFFLVRRSVFEAAQGFDERFFLYLEDLDFSYRAKQLGWSSVYFSEAQAFHAGGGTSRKIKAKRLFYSLRSRVIYAFKHFNLASAMVVAIVTLCIEPIARLANALAHRSLNGMLETMKGYVYLWAWIPQYVFLGRTR